MEVMGMSSLLISLVGAFAGALLAALFSFFVFGITVGWLYFAFIVALAILGARLARTIYMKRKKKE